MVDTKKETEVQTELPITDDDEKETVIDSQGVPLKVTANMVELSIDKLDYYQFPGTVAVTCCATLKNGFYVVETSFSVAPVNFSFEVGKRMALEKVRSTIVQYQAYYLKQLIHQSEVV